MGGVEADYRGKRKDSGGLRSRFYVVVTIPPRYPRKNPAFNGRAMKAHEWDCESPLRHRQHSARSSRRKTVAEILRLAYRQCTRDSHTRRAVKRCLR